jgi:uracil-DNA glycosylase family 4
VPAFGAVDARLLVVGLAPGLHGANASGRPFTGDQAGMLLFRCLHRFGFSDRAESRAVGDGLRLYDCRITNAVKCLPPGNLPKTTELTACNGFLGAELKQLPSDGLVLALGGVAHRAVLRACGLIQARYPFGHGALHRLPGELRLLDSYHCSRYNLQTRRLTPEQFDAVLARARELL